VGEEPKQDDKTSRGSLVRLLDVTLILAALTGVIYYVGWVEAEEFFSYFGLTAQQVGLSRERILLAGFNACFRHWGLLIAVLGGVALGCVVVTMAAGRWAWARTVVGSFAFVPGLVAALYTAAIVVVVGAFGLLLLGWEAEATGRRNAERFARRERPREVFATYVLKDGQGPEERKMLLWCGNGKYFLIDPLDSADPGARPAVTILGEDQVKHIRLVNVVPPGKKD
jgi:hypothetical protein